MPFGQLNWLAHTLRGRLLCWITLAVLVLVGATMLVVRSVYRNALMSEFSELLRAESRDISTALRDFGSEDPARDQQIKDFLNFKAKNLNNFVEILDADGKYLWGTVNRPEGLPPPVFPGKVQYPNSAALLAAPKGWQYADFDNYRMIVRRRFVYTKEAERKDASRRPLEKSDLWIRVGRSMEPVVKQVGDLDTILGFAMLGIAVVTPLGAYVIAGRATRPIAKIISTTARLDAQNLHERLPIRGTGDELDRLSQTINHMLDRIASYIERHRNFIADAAHELRSPLTAIRSSVEVSLHRPRSPEEYQNLLCDVTEECTGLANLINRLLLLAETDAGRTGRDQTASLDKLVRESLDMFQPVAESRGIDLCVDMIEPVQVRGDEFHLRQVVRNLIDNAVKFTSAPGRVVVSVRAEPESAQARLIVADTGAGIPAQDLPRIFDRFFRGDKSRPRHDGPAGFGLGLSICHTIVKSLGGDINAVSEVGQGSTFTVVLPLAVSREPSPNHDQAIMAGRAL